MKSDRFCVKNKPFNCSVQRKENFGEKKVSILILCMKIHSNTDYLNHFEMFFIKMHEAPRASFYVIPKRINLHNIMIHLGRLDRSDNIFNAGIFVGAS